MKKLDFNVNLIYTLKDRVSSAVGSVKASVNALDKSIINNKENFNALQTTMSVAAGVMIRDLVNSLSSAVTESMKLGAQIQSLQSNFDALTTNAHAMSLSLDSLREATRGTVADVDLLKAANAAMALGLPVDDIDALFASAMKLGRAMGIDTLSAVNSLATGIGRQSKLILDNLGVTFQAADAYEWYAQQIGVSASKLDENQRRLAWQKYAIEEVTRSAEALGDVSDDVITSQEQWNASMKNFQTAVGQALGPLAAFAGAFESLIPIIASIASAVLPQLIMQYGLAGTATKILHLATSKLALSVGAAMAGFTVGYMILDALTSGLDQSTKMFVGLAVAVGAAATALIVLWAVGTAGIGLPIILGAIGVAVAGVAIALSSAGADADSLANSFDSLGNKSRDLGRTIDESLTGQVALIQSSLEHQVSMVEEKYKDMSDVIQAAHDENYAAMADSYDKQIAEVTFFYDEIVGITKEALSDIRDARRDDLNDLELAYLLEKRATEEAYEAGKLSKEEFEQKLTDLEKTYRAERSDISEDYRIEELTAEIAHNEAIEIAETQGKARIEELEAEKKESLEKLNNELKGNLIDIENEKNAVIEGLTASSQSRIESMTNNYAYRIESRTRNMANSVIGSYQAINLQKLATEELTGGEGLSPYTGGLSTGGYRAVYGEGGTVHTPTLALVGDKGTEHLVPEEKADDFALSRLTMKSLPEQLPSYPSPSPMQTNLKFIFNFNNPTFSNELDVERAFTKGADKMARKLRNLYPTVRLR